MNPQYLAQQQIIGKLTEANREFFSKAMCEHRRDRSHSYRFADRTLMICCDQDSGLTAQLFFTWDDEYRLTPTRHYNKGVTQVTDRDEFEHLKSQFITAKWDDKKEGS